MLDLAWQRPEWHSRAACRGVGPDLFFPTRGESSVLEAARQVCAGCPVRAECAEAGLHEYFGVWGGLSELQRRGIRRARLRSVNDE